MPHTHAKHQKISRKSWIIWGFIFVIPPIFYPFAYYSNTISNDIIHGLLELWAASIAFSVAGFMVLYYLALNRVFFLCLSAGFTLLGSENIIQGLYIIDKSLGVNSFFQGIDLPDTYIAGRLLFTASLIVGVLFFKDSISPNNKLKKVFFLNTALFLIAAVATLLPLFFSFSTSAEQNENIRYTLLWVSAALNIVGIFLYIKLYSHAKHHTPFVWSIIASLITGLNALIYMIFSKYHSDISFDTAHILRLISCFFPLFGIGMSLLNLYKREGELVRKLSGSIKRERDLAAKAAIADFERQRADELQKINKELDNFTYVVSHDLRAPLRAIKSFGSFLVEDYKSTLPSEAQEYIDEICKGADRMNTLLDDLLTLSRISRINNPFKTIDIQNMFLVVQKMLEFDIKQYNVEINILSTLPHIYGDPIKLELVFSNLLKNAIKFSSKRTPPVIEIGYTDKPDYHEFSIKDNGIGIDPKYNRHIFELFKRLHPSDQYEGTGVGLNIVKKIIDEHKGNVRVESEIDKGATFFFTISKRLDPAH